MSLVSVIIPCYYNQENVASTFREISNVLNCLDCEFEVVFVDDGSKDQTFKELELLKVAHPHQVKVLKLVKNVGSYTAILAGMSHAKGDCLTVISADLQDPPELISQMYSHWKRGSKLVLAARIKRSDGFFNNIFSTLYHLLIQKMAIPGVPKGGFDFVMFDRELRDHVLKMNERNTNTLYLLPWLGYSYVTIPYERRKREHGKSRWTFSKKLKLFIDSFVSFTYFPIRAISVSGILLGLISLIYLLFILYSKISGKIQIEGWTATMVTILAISAFQMIALGVIGEYVWRCLDIVRNRPQYIIEKEL
ncbi:MAG: glycosyltransferase family 2 protein [Bacteriovoracaceae bacterium]|nr:glycosyltransferase family 2 protein [Bacteriovoracaceae bacterium]